MNVGEAITSFVLDLKDKDVSNHFHQNSQLSIQTKPTPLFPRALREHLSGSMIPPSLLVTFIQGVAWLGPQLRTSNDHCFIVGVP